MGGVPVGLAWCTGANRRVNVESAGASYRFTGGDTLAPFRERR